MRYRAPTSGITLTQDDVVLAKGMLDRGDRQHDVAAFFGVNAGRIAEIATGQKHSTVEPAPALDLPPPGPYPTGRDRLEAVAALKTARYVLERAEQIVTHNERLAT